MCIHFLLLPLRSFVLCYCCRDFVCCPEIRNGSARQGHGQLQLRLHSERVALHAICASTEATGSKQHEHRDAHGSLVVVGGGLVMAW